MDLPQKYGRTYIKFDDFKHPEYVFQISRGKVVKYIPLSENNDKIILPQLAESIVFTLPKNDMNAKGDFSEFNDKKVLQNYVYGRMRIGEGGFSGVKKASIIIPFESSILLEKGCFDKDAEIEFCLNENLALKQVQRIYYTGYDYRTESWPLICDKKFSGQYSMGGFGYDQYVIKDFVANKYDRQFANITTTRLSNEEQEKEF